MGNAKIQAVVVKIDNQADQIFTINEWRDGGRLEGFVALKTCKKGDINELQYPVLTDKEFNDLKNAKK
jgi:hypothetical protein